MFATIVLLSLSCNTNGTDCNVYQLDNWNSKTAAHKCVIARRELPVEFDAGCYVVSGETKESTFYENVSADTGAGVPEFVEVFNN